MSEMPNARELVLPAVSEGSGARQPLLVEPPCLGLFDEALCALSLVVPSGASPALSRNRAISILKSFVISCRRLTSSSAWSRTVTALVCVCLRVSCAASSFFNSSRNNCSPRPDASSWLWESRGDTCRAATDTCSSSSSCSISDAPADGALSAESLSLSSSAASSCSSCSSCSSSSSDRR